MFWPFTKTPKTINHAAIPSYYPHWTARNGEVTPKILNALAPDTIIGVHHTMNVTRIRSILDHPGNFTLAWYAESNVHEEDDEATGRTVEDRIHEAMRKQAVLSQIYLPNRFSDLFELDAAREKYEGEHGGHRAWALDAGTLKEMKFKYLAKSPRISEVLDLRNHLGDDFVARIVYEDVTGDYADENPGYFGDARETMKLGIPMTLIVHEGTYGDFPGTSKVKALSIINTYFNKPHIEAYHGKPTGFEKLKSFG